MDKSFLFDFLRNSYAKLNCSKPLIKTGRALLPLRYSLELTHRCNLNCPYCYIGQDRKKDELTKDQWLEVISKIPFWGFITLVGGEVTIRKDFIEILYAASKKTFGKVNVVTNGFLLSDEIINALIKSKILLLSVSLDGWGKTHDINRCHDGLFEKVKDNLEKINQKRKEKKSSLMIDIKTIVLKDNLEDLLKLYEYATKNSFEFFSISFLRNNNLKQNGTLFDDFNPIFYEKEYPIESYFDMEKFKEIYKEISKIRKTSKTKIRFAPKFEADNYQKELELIEKFFNEYKNKDITKIYEPCLYPYSNIIINPKGDVYPCLSAKMGNILEDKLSNILNYPKYRCFRKNLKYSKVFSACQMCCELKVKNIDED